MSEEKLRLEESHQAKVEQNQKKFLLQLAEQAAGDIDMQRKQSVFYAWV